MSGGQGDKGERGDKGETGDQGPEGDKGEIKITTRWRPSRLAVVACVAVLLFMGLLTWLTVVRG